jgi:hypothetical protein
MTAMARLLITLLKILGPGGGLKFLSWERAGLPNKHSYQSVPNEGSTIAPKDTRLGSVTDCQKHGHKDKKVQRNEQ